MKTTTWLAVGLLAGIAVTVGQTASAASDTCDRECLRGTMTTFLYALLEHDASKVPVADTVRVTEDGIEKPLARRRAPDHRHSAARLPPGHPRRDAPEWPVQRSSLKRWERR